MRHRRRGAEHATHDVGVFLLEDDVGAGEILFVPADWWHTARAIGTAASVSVAASFVDAQGLEAFLDAYGEFEAMRSLVEHGAGVIT